MLNYWNRQDNPATFETLEEVRAHAVGVTSRLWVFFLIVLFTFVSLWQNGASRLQVRRKYLLNL